MNNVINHYVEAMFATLPKTRDLVQMKLNIMEHMTDQYEALLAEGKNENEALGTVIAQFGSIEEIKKAFGIPDAVPDSDAAAGLTELEEQLLAFQSRARFARIAAVMLFIFGPILGIYFLSFMLFAAAVAAGVGILMYTAGRLEDYREAIDRRRVYPDGERPEEEPIFLTPQAPQTRGEDAYPRIGRRRRIFYAMLPLVAVVIYLFYGIEMNAWHPGWIIFLCVPLAIGVLEIIRIGAEEKKEKEGKNQ